MAFLFSTHKKQSQVKCNLILIYIMCWPDASLWKNSMNVSGDVLLENTLFEKEWIFFAVCYEWFLFHLRTP